MLCRAIHGTAWRTILIAAMGEELTSEEREVFAKLTGGRDHEPGEMIEMLLVVAGRSRVNRAP
jgi:hypothetical protein